MKGKPNSKLTVLKLGGSVLTKKEKPLTPNLNAIQRLSKEIADAKVEHLIIVHGGGSFGHPIATQYSTKIGQLHQLQIKGFSKTHQAMLELNKLVVDSLVRHNTNAFSISPSSCLITNAGRIQDFYDATLRMLLQAGGMPVLFGDAVLDSKIGFTVLSGDQLVTVLALNFKADKIIFGVDVDGVCTGDPKTDVSARLIPHLTLQQLKTLLHSVEEAKVTDITGGMLGKMRELIPAVKTGIQTLIVNASKEDNVYKALKEKRNVGTLIERE